jgi:hypothetical protein
MPDESSFKDFTDHVMAGIMTKRLSKHMNPIKKLRTN